MDPVSAIGLVAAICQFVDFAAKIVHGARQVYTSDAMMAASDADSLVCASELDALSIRLNPPGLLAQNPDDEALFRLANRCRVISSELSALLRITRAKEPDSKWHSFVSSLKSHLKKSERDDLLRRLADCRAQLNLQLIRMNNLDSKALHQQVLRSLQSNDVAFQRLLAEISNIRENVTLTSLSSQAELQLQRIFALPDDSRKALTRGKILNLLQYETAHERFDDIITVDQSCFSWAIDETVRLAPIQQPHFRSPQYSQTGPSQHRGKQQHIDFEPSPNEVVALSLDDFGESTSAGAEDESNPSSPSVSLCKNQFCAWLQYGAGIFHVVGKPYTGKSVLMKFLCDHEATARMLNVWAEGSKLILAKFFLCYDGSKKQRTIAGLCRSILHDILEQCPELIEKALPDLVKLVESHPWQLEFKTHLRADRVENALIHVLEILSRSSECKACIFIDGLDEYNDDFRNFTTLSDLLCHWTQSGGQNVKLCVASRPDSAFLRAFDQHQRIWIEQYSGTEVRKLVRERLQVAVSAGGYEQDIMGQILDAIVQRSAGNFPWAASAASAIANTLLRDESLALELRLAHSRTPGQDPRTVDQLALEQILLQQNVPSYPPTPQSAGRLRSISLAPGSIGFLESESRKQSVVTHQESGNAEQTLQLKSLLGITTHYEDDYFAAEDARLAGTCEWINERASYRDWVDSKANGTQVLWLVGKPASGKSTLTSYIISQLQQQRGASVIYFFFKHADRSKAVFGACLKALAYQTALHSDQVRAEFLAVDKAQIESVNPGTGGLSSENQNERLLWRKLFVDIILRSSLEEQYWVIDGLDECENFAAAFTSLLAKSVHSIRLRILITSRETASLKTEFDNVAARMSLNTECIEAANTLKDIKLLVQARGSVLSSIEQHSSQHLIEQIVSKSRGSFLWTTLILQELVNTYSDSEAKRVLEEVPRGMTALYQRILKTLAQADRDQTFMRAVLTWVTCAPRPLSVEELDGALLHHLGKSFPNLKVRLLAVGGQLLTIDKVGRVNLVHETAREFLLDTAEPSDFSISAKTAHAIMAAACLECLSGPDMQAPRPRKRFNSNKTSIKRTSFSIYAALNFSYHLRLADLTAADLIMLLDTFLKTNVLSWIECIANTSSVVPLVAAAADMDHFVTKHMTTALAHERELQSIKIWAKDLTRLSAKFADALLANPAAIFSILPPFCPKHSCIAGIAKPERGLTVIGSPDVEWDDRLSCIDLRTRASCVCFDDKFFAVGLAGPNGMIHIYRATTGQEHKVYQHEEALHMIRFLYGTELLASCGNRFLRIWNVFKDQVQHVLPMPGPCLDLAYRSNILYAACHKGFLASWDVSDGACRLPDKPWNADPDVHDNQPLRPPSAVSISTAHDMIAIASPGHPILLWSISDDMYYGTCGKRLPNGEVSKHNITAMVFNTDPDRPLLAASYLDGELAILDPFEDDTLTVVRAECPKLAASPNGVFLAGAAGSGTIDVYHFETLQLIYRVTSSKQYIAGLAFSRDSCRLADIRGSICNIWGPSRLRREDMIHDQSGDASCNQPPVTVAISEPKIKISAIANPTDDNHVLCGQSDGAVAVYSLRDGSQTEILYRHKSNVHSLHWWSRLNLCLSVDASNAIHAWKMARSPHGGLITKEQIFQGRSSSQKAITQLLVSETNDNFILSTNDSAHLWSCDGQELSSRPHSPPTHTWIQHPTSAMHVLRIEPTSVYIHNWTDLSEIKRIPIAVGGGLQLKSARVCVVEQTQAVLLELCQLDGNAGTKDVCLLDVECLKITADDQIEPDASTIQKTQPSIEAMKRDDPVQHIAKLVFHGIGFLENGRFVFLDKQSWICSVHLKRTQPGVTLHYHRHFFVPHEWYSGTREILCGLVKRHVLFARNDKVAVISGGLEYVQEVTMTVKGD
ncbi:hypothetical protein CKM354_000980200 [Cercospora kikuchii]|uniref:NACHT domain-containing protein n=1 Tax=Cercospora kikuchii TaxID=84275 RepID=A0A9P3CPR4_9PEZI|nr:uncharacterized protein CKM354_000980200 [Cercospora kikuchii]GIZ46684.1 hypothetical protein CKM354_000980200 [Cercospora kikuchii]